MKNKRITYFLVIAVVLIWGIIIFRLYLSINVSDDASIVLQKQIREKYDDFTTHRDTARLILNYRDPFGLMAKITKDTVSQISIKHKLQPAKIITPVKPTIDWGFIKYSGYIRNPDSKRLIAILKINGINRMLSEGELTDGILLIKNMRDSLKIKYNGTIKCINLQPASL